MSSQLCRLLLIRSWLVLVISISMFTSISIAKCKGFDDGVPNFCATLKILEKKGMEDDLCLYSGEILEIEKTEPLSHVYRFYEEKLSKEKRYIFRVASNLCKDDITTRTLRSVIVAQCNDNVMIGRSFLEKIGVLPPLANFSVADNPSVQINENGNFKNVKVFCPKQK